MTFWSSQTLEAKLGRLVDGSNKDLVDCNAVTLRVGREIYITPGLEQAAPASHTKQLLDVDEPFAIPPGQFAFLLTEETITIPIEAMGFISIKATYKLKGLVNVSGFHVDPGWSGPLIFAVFNVGPAPVHLQRGLPLFLLWIADLDAPSKKRKSKPGPDGIPPAMINNITGVVDSIYALDRRVREEIKKVNDKNTDLSNRIHAVDKAQNRVLLGLGIASTLLVALVGVAMRAAWLSFI
ncbi:deoxycytidine triphosphate deaminase [Mesorhizobium sp. M0924]|uniref:dCTP deaminase domain-containing protein n=1 Tax=unclassified Mesorhizobium TaxID=325217 RepID=UPI003334B17B